jgi:hypothetical protein
LEGQGKNGSVVFHRQSRLISVPKLTVFWRDGVAFFQQPSRCFLGSEGVFFRSAMGPFLMPHAANFWVSGQAFFPCLGSPFSANFRQRFSGFCQREN